MVLAWRLRPHGDFALRQPPGYTSGSPAAQMSGFWAGFELIARRDRRRSQHLPDEPHTTLSTHVLDVVRGAPARGLEVRLLSGENQVGSGRTGPDGRLTGLASSLEPGVYRLVFETGAYFGSASHLIRRVSLDV